MKNSFPWYFPPTIAEISDIWETGTLTLDANVLLDLYRYHENTRKNILQAISSFSERVWLSHQTAEEFFRNRAKVIIESHLDFEKSLEIIDTLTEEHDKSISKIKALRAIPNGIIDSLEKNTNSAFKKAKDDIVVSQKTFPDYFERDPILDEILQRFDGAIGQEFTEQELKDAKIEGERRKKQQIPPGYLDKDKDNDKPYGDYYMWRQILHYAEEGDKSLIFVTSERKADWWERHSGKTVGARQELKQEAYQNTGRHILIYQTDRFLEFVAERSGKKVDKRAVEEIRDFDNLRNSSGNFVKVISQTTNQCDTNFNCGNIAIELSKPLFVFTGSGHFTPELSDPPRLWATLTSAPENIPKHRIGAGTGTTHDFNIHLRSEEFGVPFPPGIYHFAYNAKC